MAQTTSSAPCSNTCAARLQQAAPVHVRDSASGQTTSLWTQASSMRVPALRRESGDNVEGLGRVRDLTRSVADTTITTGVLKDARSCLHMKQSRENRAEEASLYACKQHSPSSATTHNTDLALLHRDVAIMHRAICIAVRSCTRSHHNTMVSQARALRQLVAKRESPWATAG